MPKTTIIEIILHHCYEGTNFSFSCSNVHPEKVLIRFIHCLYAMIYNLFQINGYLLGEFCTNPLLVTGYNDSKTRNTCIMGMAICAINSCVWV
jgi:hypothetical protein